MTSAGIILLAWGVEVDLGWPDWLYKRIRHPVVWLGWLISMLERALNNASWHHRLRYGSGAVATIICVVVSAVVAWAVSRLLPPTLWGGVIEALIASSLIASRSLYAHVAAVYRPLAEANLCDARQAVSQIVGRNPSRLDENGIARASLESLAENTSDGVIAPIFWGVIFGLPGLVAYKAINTLDSMIGHKTERYAAFGGFAARADDIANLVPARITGFLFCLASLQFRAFSVMLRDARRHRAGRPSSGERRSRGRVQRRLERRRKLRRANLQLDVSRTGRRLFFASVAMKSSAS